MNFGCCCSLALAAQPVHACSQQQGGLFILMHDAMHLPKVSVLNFRMTADSRIQGGSNMFMVQSVVYVQVSASGKPANFKYAWVLQGYGTLLMEEAERIAKREHRSHKLAVISGVGTRHYYRKLGYHLEGHYMVKSLR